MLLQITSYTTYNKGRSTTGAECAGSDRHCQAGATRTSKTGWRQKFVKHVVVLIEGEVAEVSQVTVLLMWRGKVALL